MGGGAWSNDQPREFLFPPGGSLSSPHILIGPDIPAVLTSFSADYTWQFAMLWYYDSTNFAFQALAINHVFGIDEWITGTYDTVSGVQFKQIISGPGDAFPNSLYFGSDFYGTANKLLVEWRNANLVVDNISTLTSENGILNDGTAEVWHALALQNLWVNVGAPFVTGQFRLVPSPALSVQVIGTIKNGTAAPGTVIATLPAGYRPATTQRNPIYAFGGTLNITTEVPAIDTASNGEMTLKATTNATVLAFDFLISLDA